MTTTSEESAIRIPTAAWPLMQAFVLLAIVSFLSVVVTGVATWGVVKHYVSVSTEQATMLDAAFTLANAASELFYLLSAIATLFVMYRLMKNAHALKREDDMISPGWAVGFWFIPFANLVMPPKAVGQIWRATLEPERGSAVIGWWWALFICGNIVLTFGERIADADPAGNEWYHIFVSTMFVLRTVCAVLLLVIFGTLVKGQKAARSMAETPSANAA